MRRRATSSAIERASALCRGCQWSTAGANALGLAAQHHDRTGHAVAVEEHRVTVYGDPSAAPAGQTTLMEVVACR